MLIDPSTLKTGMIYQVSKILVVRPLLFTVLVIRPLSGQFFLQLSDSSTLRTVFHHLRDPSTLWTCNFVHCFGDPSSLRTVFHHLSDPSTLWICNYVHRFGDPSILRTIFHHLSDPSTLWTFNFTVLVICPFWGQFFITLVIRPLCGLVISPFWWSVHFEDSFSSP